MDRRSVRGGEVRRIDEVLDADGQSAQRRAIALGIDASRLGERGLCVECFPGLHHGLALGDPREAFAHELLGGSLPPGKPRHGLGGPDHAVHQARASCV